MSPLLLAVSSRVPPSTGEGRRRVPRTDSQGDRERQSRIRRDNHQRLLHYFADHPCADCGEDDHVVLTFDHVKGEKRFTIADRLYTMRWAPLLDEITKCEGVRTATCGVRPAGPGTTAVSLDTG